ncbi:uncharacterized protein LOC135847988 [Planococcus citri]|uniref:uncharacterized protein LOC135847988 n=1 Tax=Planococcus citri TaxID=170843 RepID=UPI0031F96FE2
MVVSVKNENKSTDLAGVSEFLQRLSDEAGHVPVDSEPLNVPVWFDAEKFKKGQQFFFKNYYAMFVTKLCGLIVVLSVPSVLKVLILTGKSNTPARAFRRYIDTIANVQEWYCSDLTEINSDSRKALITVRGKHCAASKKAISNGIGFISQRDMALTQFGFIGIAIMKCKSLGFVGTDEEFEGFIHFWRTIGYCMGIEDRFNICNGSVNQVVEICIRLTDDVFKPYLEKPCENFNEMCAALLNGLKPVSPSLTVNSFMEVCRRNMNFEPKEVDGIYSKCMLGLLLYIHNVLLSVWWVAVIFRPFLNWMMRFSVYCNIKFPLVAYLTMGKEVWADNETHHNTREFHHNVAVVKAN